MPKSSTYIQVLQYLAASTRVPMGKYSSLGLSKLIFRFVKKVFSTKRKYFFKPLKIFEKSNADGKGIKRAREKQRSAACSPLVHLPQRVLIVLLYENRDVD